MSFLDAVRLGIGGILIIGGVGLELVAVLGVFRLSYILNRMHIAAVGDTAGLFCILAGLMVFSGLNIMTLKFLLIILFFWIASPVSGHLLAKMEVTLNKKSEKKYEVENR